MTDQAPDSGADRDDEPTGGRRRLAAALIVLASILAFVAILSVWVNRQFLNTVNYTATSSELLENRTIRKALAGPRVLQLWEDGNRAAHLQLLVVLEGGGSVVATEGGRVVLDTGALLTELQAQVGLGGRAAGLLPEGAGQITIMESDELALAQDALVALRSLPIVLVALSLMLFAIALSAHGRGGADAHPA